MRVFAFCACVFHNLVVVFAPEVGWPEMLSVREVLRRVQSCSKVRTGLKTSIYYIYLIKNSRAHERESTLADLTRLRRTLRFIEKE